MNFITRLLGWAQTFSTENLRKWDSWYTGPNQSYTSEQEAASYATKFSWVADIFNPISIVLYVIMGLIGAAGAIYAIYLGIQLARAEDQSKRDEAKKHLITVLIAIAVTVVLILFFNEIMPMIVEAFIKPSK